MFLSEEAFDRAVDFIAENGRPLEVARYAVHFEDEAFDDLDEELRVYRNDDGGFAHGLEPDFHCEESSAAATVSALEILSETGAPPESDLVIGAVEYLVKTYDQELRGWHKVPAEVNEYAHAEWWEYPDGGAANNAPENWGLTNADVVAYLNDYSMLVPKDFLDLITREAQSRLLELPDRMDMHAFAAFHRLAMRLAPEQRLRMVAKLSRAAVATVERDPEKWNAYVASPLYLVSARSSPLANLMPFDVETNLDYEIVNQLPDGSWRPRWRWQNDPEGWAEAEMQWAGIVTLKTLMQLADFDRISGL
jgi:hypothetical protein